MIDYRILSEQQLVAVCIWGVTSLEDILKHRAKVLADPDFSNAYDVILDTTYMESQYTGEEMRKLAGLRNDADRSPCKLATIAPSDLAFGLSRMHELMTQHANSPEIRVFRDVPSALKWLDREEIDIETIFTEIRDAMK